MKSAKLKAGSVFKIGSAAYIMDNDGIAINLVCGKIVEQCRLPENVKACYKIKAKDIKAKE